MLKSSYFCENRKKLTNKIGEGFTFLSAYEKSQKTADMAGEFWQEANFFWLSGIEWPEWKILINNENDESWLIEPDVSSIQKSFEGFLSKKEATKVSGVDNFLSQQEAFEMIKNKKVYVLEPEEKSQIWCRGNFFIKKHWEETSKLTDDIEDIRKYINPLRVIKSDYEIEKIKEAIKITKNAFDNLDKSKKDFKFESDIEALFNYNFTKNQAKHAYSPIVASGKNACIMHYDKNNSEIKGPVLIDSGARKNNFSADVTRMIFLNKPSNIELEVYKKLSIAQKNIIDLIKPGVLIRKYLEKSDEIMKNAIKDLGLIENISDFRKFYPHAISHGLGLDVHEGLGGFETFQSGMVLTVEPGIYIENESIGFRIEDDILVTKKGNINLTEGIKKEFLS